jgi:integrase
LSLPEVAEVRRRIEKAAFEPIRFCLMTQYLCGSRISELIGEECAGDTAKARILRKEDLRFDFMNINGRREDALIINLRTAKRQGKPRIIALPLREEFEPWTRQIANYSLEKKDAVFPFTRQLALYYATRERVFKGLSYPIENYKDVVRKEGAVIRQTVKSHTRPFNLHALRHLRASELVGYFGFDAFQLGTFGGWTYKTTAGISNVMARYLSLSWQSYFPKLCKRRNKA